MNFKDLSRIVIVKRMKLRNTVGKQITTLTEIRRKVVDRESRLISKKIKETTHSLRSPNHVNQMLYILPELWYTSLW